MNDVVGIAEVVDMLSSPEFAGDPHGDRWISGQFRVFLKRYVQPASETAIVGATRQLDEPTALIAHAVPGFGVAEILYAAFVFLTARIFNEGGKPIGFSTHLCDEVSLPEQGTDIVIYGSDID